MPIPFTFFPSPSPHCSPLFTFPIALPSLTSSHHTFSSIQSSPSSSSSSYSSSSQSQEPYDYDYDYDNPLGDCIIYEEGIFEDSFGSLNKTPTQSNDSTTARIRKPKKNPPKTLETLVPEDWEQVVDEINVTKKERRRMAREAEYRKGIERRKGKGMVIKGNENENFDENVRDWGERYGDQRGEESGGHDEEDVEARRLRWAVYGREVVDDAKLFQSEMYGNGDGARGRGRTKLFTKEERNLLNARAPKLEVATSVKWLPLHSLAASGDFILLTSLLKHVDEINAKDQEGLTALHKAIISKQQSITTCLLRESANALVRDNYGATLLHYAVRTASVQAIKMLLKHKVDINLPDNDGWTPLHLAVQARRTDIVRFLLINGADKTLKNKDGLTPLELCLYSGRDTKTYLLIKLLKQFRNQPRRAVIEQTRRSQ
ncbi:hypothetical protein Droror1_Dr00022040 [Drosera rotundifolia]